MFITINRLGNLESTININQIVEFRVYETSDPDKKYVSIFTTNNTVFDISFEQYEALLKIIPLMTKCKINVPEK